MQIHQEIVTTPESGPGSHQTTLLFTSTGYKISVVHSHWSRNVEAGLSLVESFIVLKYFHGVATPAGSLWHKRAGIATA